MAEGRSRRRAQGDWLRAELALGALLLFCPLAVATVHPWAVATACGLSLLALLLTAWASMRGGEPFAWPAPAGAFLVAAAFTAFQLLPLPPFLVGLLAPTTRELFEYVLGPLGRYPAWRPLSLDPPATARELAKALTYLATFLAAAQLVRSRRTRARVVTVLGVSGLLVSLIGFAHALWGATSLFGIFTFEYAAPPFLTPFGNPNHLASFLCLTACALLARVLLEKDRKVATLWAFAYVATGVGVLLSLSRGGIVTFVAAQAMLAFGVRTSRRSEREGQPVRARAVVVPAVVTVVLAVSAYLAWDALAQEWASTDSLEKVRESKIAMWPSFLPMVRAHWLVGVGHGAFESAYQRFQDPSAFTTYTNPENIVAQWVADLGVPLALAVFATCAWALARGLWRGVGEPERLACGVALAAVALHDLVDFGLELGGLAVPATVAFAVVVSRREGMPTIRRRAALAAVPVAAALALAALLGARSSLEADGKALAALVGKTSPDEFAAKVTEAAVRHPSDYYPHLLAAQEWAAQRPLKPERVAFFASRAMFLNPTLSLPHRLAARALRAAGRPAQAQLEYRLAYEAGDRSVVKEVTSVFRGEEMRAGLPDTEAALGDLADELMAQKRLDDADLVVKASLETHREHLGALSRAARLASLRGQADEELEIGQRMSAVAPDRIDGLRVRAAALQARNDVPGAIRLLEEEGLKRFPLDSPNVLELARLKLSLGDTRGCRDALKRLPAGADVRTRAAGLALESGASERDGQATKAIAAMRSAAGLLPGDPGMQWNLALLMERVGRLDAAIGEAEEAAAKGAWLAPHLEQLKARVAKRKAELEELTRWRQLEGGPDAGPDG